MSQCPYCHLPANASAENGHTCGSFQCLYRRYAGRDVPSPIASRPLPWVDPADVHRIAVLRPGQVGDVLLAVPALRALERHFYNAKTTLIARPWASDLADRFSSIDSVVALESSAVVRSGSDDTGVRGDLAARILDRCYDLVLQIHGDDPAASRYALGLSGRSTVGYCRDAETAFAFDVLLGMEGDEPEVLRILRLADALGAPPAGIQLEFPMLPTDVAEVESLPELHGALGRSPLIAIHAGARAPARRWPADRFAELARRLRRQWDATLVMAGGLEECSLVAGLIESSGVPAVNVAGKLSLGGLAALLARVDLFVGNDSGPAQLAAAVSPRSLRIFGPANRRRWAPLDSARHRAAWREVDCSPCGHWECPIGHLCLQGISVDDVAAAVDALLQQVASPIPVPALAVQPQIA